MTDWRDQYGGTALMDLPQWALEDHAGAVCHRFFGDAPAAACGVPRCEQPDHGGSMPAYLVRGQSHCPWCGNALCARCLDVIGRAAA